MLLSGLLTMSNPDYSSYIVNKSTQALFRKEVDEKLSTEDVSEVKKIAAILETRCGV